MSQTVVPLHPDVRYYCSGCDKHFYNYQRADHDGCIEDHWCSGCGFACVPGMGACERCGTEAPALPEST